MKNLVVDASVIIDLLSDPGGLGHSLAARLEGHDLHAPEYLAVEVANVLRKLRNSGLLSDGEASVALQGLWNLPIQWWAFEVLSPRAWQLGHTLTAYDAAYVALAERIDAPLVTGDRRLARASGPTCIIEVFDADPR